LPVVSFPAKELSKKQGKIKKLQNISSTALE
jgi:hypothetical protein